jgi:very-short-patch-repair endonuclease
MLARDDFFIFKCAKQNNPIPSSLKELAKKLRKESTPGERLLWKHIRNKASSVEFHRQVPIDTYIVDFYSHEIKLAIEIDGGTHNDEHVYQNDMVRQKKLEEFGIRVIRFLERDVKADTTNVLRAIEGVISELLRRE